MDKEAGKLTEFDLLTFISYWDLTRIFSDWTNAPSIFFFIFMILSGINPTLDPNLSNDKLLTLDLNLSNPYRQPQPLNCYFKAWKSSRALLSTIH